MGAWGEGLFENDSAADLVVAVMRTPPAGTRALVDAALAAVVEPEDAYLDVDHISQGLAAVALLLADRDPTVLAGVADPDDLPTVLAAADLTLDDDLVARAHAVLDRTLRGEDNEWHELWEDAGGLDDARAPVHRLRALLPTRT